MSWVMAMIGVVGGFAGVVSAFISWRQWRKTNRKIAMLNDASAAAEVLPAWYTGRMMTDDWMFGLLTVTGQMIAITGITAISDDGKWMDVDLAESDETETISKKYPFDFIHAAGEDRTTASVQISTIVAAVDLWTT